MTDYKNLKLRASSNPHIRNGEDTRGLMLDVIIALMPALLFGVWHFGVRVAISAVVSVASAIFFEWLYRKLLHKPQMIGDLSAAVTGLLLSMVCPPELPVWMLVVGNFFAIFVVKQLYGGLGKNFLNPALAARAALVACYASAMTSWSKVDAATGATPMALLKAGDMEALTAAYPIKDMAIGFISGSAGEVSALMLLIGGVYLIVRKVISWQTPVAYIATVAVVTFLFPRGNDPMTFMELFVTGNGYAKFMGGYSNAEYDALVDQAGSSQDDAERLELFGKAEALLMEEGGVIPLYFNNNQMYIQSYVSGLSTPMFGTEYEFSRVKILKH